MLRMMMLTRRNRMVMTMTSVTGSKNARQGERRRTGLTEEDASTCGLGLTQRRAASDFCFCVITTIAKAMHAHWPAPQLLRSLAEHVREMFTHFAASSQNIPPAMPRHVWVVRHAALREPPTLARGPVLQPMVVAVEEGPPGHGEMPSCH